MSEQIPQAPQDDKKDVPESPKTNLEESIQDMSLGGIYDEINHLLREFQKMGEGVGGKAQRLMDLSDAFSIKSKEDAKKSVDERWAPIMEKHKRLFGEMHKTFTTEELIKELESRKEEARRAQLWVEDLTAEIERRKDKK